MRQICVLQKALQKKPKYSYLATMAVILCKATERELLGTVQQTNESSCAPQSNAQQVQPPNLAVVIHGVEISFHLTCQSLHKLSQSKNGKPHCGQVTYYLVCLFESTMTALAQHCRAISKHKSSTGKPLPGTKSKAEARTKTMRKTSESQNTADEIGPRLAGLLHTMARSLDLTRSENQQVMEGFLYILIRRTGRILALVVFENLEVPARIPLPEGLDAMKVEDLSAENARLEGKYLVWLLEKLLAVLDHESIAGSQFVVKVKNRLQKTLLQAVWGNDLLFQNGLMRPATPPAQNLGAQKGSQQSLSDWFTQELWRLIGWDMLNSVLEPGDSS